MNFFVNVAEVLVILVILVTFACILGIAVQALYRIVRGRPLGGSRRASPPLRGPRIHIAGVLDPEEGQRCIVCGYLLTHPGPYMSKDGYGLRGFGEGVEVYVSSAGYFSGVAEHMEEEALQAAQRCRVED